MQKNYLSIKLLQNLLAALFIEKTTFLSKFFSVSEFGMRVYKGKMDAKNGGTFLYTFLRISPRKINILKNSKLGLRELNKLNDMNAKKMLLNLSNILKPTIEMPKKMKKNKSAQNFFILKYVIEHFKTSKFYY